MLAKGIDGPYISKASSQVIEIILYDGEVNINQLVQEVGLAKITRDIYYNG